uniref:ABC transporter domain-containing protein n=1 Tax=Oryza punctata TaxID=4537 RepID=A0A0E0M013_ORYPU
MDDGGETYGFGGRRSLRREGSAWSSAAGSVFSRSSSTRKDNEEDLRWAALEKLPTYDRARTALLAMPDGELREVNVQRLAADERRALLQRAAGVADDHSRFLSKFKERLDRVGIKLPTIEVRYENLNVEAESYVGRRGLPTILNTYVNILEGLGNTLRITPKKKKKISILRNVSGNIKPHRMTLLLGPPGSGKTSLLMAMAGTLPSTVKAATTGEQKAEVVTNHILKMLGLDICADTIVGNNMLRAEMLVTPGRALFMDEISTGLDSSTIFQIVNSIRQTISILGGTTIIALLQPAPETYELFDDIILLSDGQVIYNGPRDHVLEFFKSLGFKCPERKGVADFLQEVTSRKDQKQYWIHDKETYHYVPVADIAEAFQSFHAGQAIRAELAVPFHKSESHLVALRTSKYGLTMVAINAMTVFMRTNMHRDSIENGRIYMGAQFYGMIMIMFNGLAEMGLTIAKLLILLKQRDLLFYPAWTYSLPSWIIKTPISFLNTTVWVFLTYYVIGFDPNIERFFGQFLALFVMSEATSELFRFIAALARDPVVASTMGSFNKLFSMLSSGFILSRDDIKKWWIWGYWISPLMYSLNTLAVNEFLGSSWNKTIAGVREPLGRLVLQSRGFSPEAKWYWIGVGVLLGYVLILNILYTIYLTFLTCAEDDNNDEATSNDTIWTYSLGRKGMVLPFVPLSITFEDIRYCIDMPEALKAQGMIESRLDLLKDISGSFRPGVLTALMGVSGAGKTTLLDVLAGRKTSGYIEGNITISGYPKKQETFARVSGYCEQNDIHSPNITVYESLMFSAWLRLPIKIDYATRKMFIDEVMELIELLPLKDSLVGLPGITGLSTEQRKRLTIAVELIANPSVIFLDEPTSGLDARAAAIVMRAIRNTIDTGRTVVCTIHQPSIDIFESFDELFLMKRGGEEIYVGPLGQHSCELIRYFKAIEGVSKIKHGYNPSTWMLEVTSMVQEQITGVNFSKVYKNSELYRRNKILIKELSKSREGSSDLSFPTPYSQPFITQCLACLWKQRQSYWRNPRYIVVKHFFTIIVAFLFGTMFWGIGRKRQDKQALFSAMGSMYSTCLTMGVQNSSSVQPIVSVERIVFYRERASHMYSPLPYALGQRIPVWWRWYYWICPVAWTLNGLVTSQFGDVMDKFDNGQRVSDFVKSYFGYQHDLLWVAAIAVVSFAILFAFLFGLSLKLLNFQKR